MKLLNMKFDAVYVVRADGSVVRLDAKVSNNKLVFKNKGLGKYIISYKSTDTNKGESNNNNTKPIEDEKKKTNYIFYIIGGVSVLSLGGAIFYVTKKNKY